MKTSTPKARCTTSGKGNKMHAPIASANHFKSLTIEEASDAEDGNYSSSSSASGRDTEVEAITAIQDLLGD